MSLNFYIKVAFQVNSCAMMINLRCTLFELVMSPEAEAREPGGGGIRGTCHPNCDWGGNAPPNIGAVL